MAEPGTGGITTLVPVKVETFHEIPIRIAEAQTGPTIPLNDVADGIGYDRSSLRKLVKRNKELLDGDITKVIMDSVKGHRDVLCITKDGVLVILSKLDYKRIEDKEKQARIIEFQKWVKQTLAERMQTTLVKEEIKPKEDWSSVAIGHLNLAREIARQNPTMDPTMCLAIGLRQAERATGMDLSAYKRLIPPAPVQFQEEYLTATQIGHEVGRTAVEVNRYLHRWGFLYRGDDDVYYLTTSGAEYGKVFAGAFDSGHNGYFIKWKRSVIGAAKMRQNSPTRILD